MRDEYAVTIGMTERVHKGVIGVNNMIRLKAPVVVRPILEEGVANLGTNLMVVPPSFIGWIPPLKY